MSAHLSFLFVIDALRLEWLIRMTLEGIPLVIKGVNEFITLLKTSFDLANGISDFLHSEEEHQAREELKRQEEQFQINMEKNRQAFQIRINEENAKAQKELYNKRHELMLIEQQHHFDLLCKRAEWQHFLNDWPLRVQPSVLREEQVLQDGTVALRVLFAKSNDTFFESRVYPKVEQGLQEFVDSYHNYYNSHNIIYYHNAYKEGIYAGASTKNIRYALRELPVIVLESNVLEDEICISATIWGFGSNVETHATVFKLPYHVPLKDSAEYNAYAKELSDQILAFLKLLLGVAYDNYNLIMYNRLPLFPLVAQSELKDFTMSINGSFYSMKGVLINQYKGLYAAILRKGAVGNEQDITDKTDRSSKTNLHLLRLEFANAIRSYFSTAEYYQILDDSITAWCALRSKEDANSFLQILSQESSDLSQYFNCEDIKYFLSICDEYKTIGINGNLKESCLVLYDRVMSLKEKLEQKKAVKPGNHQGERRKLISI